MRYGVDRDPAAGMTEDSLRMVEERLGLRDMGWGTAEVDAALYAYDAWPRISDSIRIHRVLNAAQAARRSAEPGADAALREEVANLQARLAVSEAERCKIADTILRWQADSNDELAAAEARADAAERVLAPFLAYAQQHPYLDGAEGEIGEFYGQALRVSISYRDLRAARDYAREHALAAGSANGGEHGD